MRVPGVEGVRASAARLGLHLDAAEVDLFAAQLALSIESYRALRTVPQTRPPVRHPRTPGHAPDPDDNPLGAWYWRCSIPGAAGGPLAGRTVSLKDNICVAGVPMSNGSAVLEGFVPDIDATVVTRVLDAGATVTGKAVAEAFGLSSGSNTASTGAVRNPHRPSHSAGGSSSGSAALVASGACDLSIGSDQGGSVRIPASLCGIVGVKPTYGLVPYTGALSIEPTLDHLGPLTRTVEEAALLLTVLAGNDGMDPRQRGVPEHPTDYGRVLDEGVRGLRIGVLREGFQATGPFADEAHALVRSTVARLERAGAQAVEVSVPPHLEAGNIVTPIYSEGIRAQLIDGRGLGFGWRGYYPVSVADYLGRVWPTSADRLSDTGKLFLLLGDYMHHEYSGRYYAMAQNQVLWLRQAYDTALVELDALVMPTCAPSPVALPLPEDPSPNDVFDAAFGYHLNTAPFNVTEHPAITVPCGEIDGLPMGVMFVARHFEESVLLRLARAVQDGFDRPIGERTTE